MGSGNVEFVVISSGNVKFSQDNVAKALIIMIIKKMTFSQQESKMNTQKWGNFEEELNDTQEWGEILKIDLKLGRLSSPSPFLGSARPGEAICQIEAAL